MATFRVVLVCPEHDTNVGAAVRAMKNFGATDLAIVAPVAPLGFGVQLYAKHSGDVFERARVCKTLRQALSGCDYAVATTGVPERYRGRLKKCIPLPDLPGLALGYRRVALVFGPESRGLSQAELDKCDVAVTIPSSNLHKVLNLSHAVAVVMYELYSRMRADEQGPVLAGRRERHNLEEAFGRIVAGEPVVRDGRKVAKAFQNVLERSRVHRDEAAALMAAFGPLSRRKPVKRI